MWNVLFLLSAVVFIFFDSIVRAEKAVDSDSTNNNTPHTNVLECYSTSSPHESILCPVDRSAFCVKEIASSSRQYCGGSADHAFDTWDIKELGGQCVYKKCASKCLSSNETSVFENQGEWHTRSTFCCSESLCNSCEIYARLGSAGFVCIVITIMFIILDA